MGKYTLTPHIGDVSLKVEGANLKSLFKASLRGMSELTKKNACVGQQNFSEVLSLSSSDVTGLLIEFLSAVLAFQKIKKAVYCDVKFDELTENTLRCQIFGCEVDSFDEKIKDVNYDEASVKENNDGSFSTTIIFNM